MIAQTVQELVDEYYTRLRNAGSADEKQAIAQEYHAYYNRLSDADKAEAKRVMQSRAAALRQRLEQFEPMIERGKAILAKYELGKQV